MLALPQFVEELKLTSSQQKELQEVRQHSQEADCLGCKVFPSFMSYLRRFVQTRQSLILELPGLTDNTTGSPSWIPTCTRESLVGFRAGLSRAGNLLRLLRRRSSSLPCRGHFRTSHHHHRSQIAPSVDRAIALSIKMARRLI